MSAPPAEQPEARRGAGLERLLPLACLGGGVLLFASQFMDIFELNSPGPTVQDLITSADQHWYAMAVLGLYAVFATVGAVALGSKPLAVSVAVAGLAALLLFLLIDLPDAGKTGTLNNETVTFLTAEADPAGGFWLELLGALVLAVCGTALATLSSQGLRDLRFRGPSGREKRRFAAS
ncbi:MAG TPA: hypothetical protein VKA89_10295 [Solirubrobacterales bacterium]|nr:hypothetical protein [Solirubrobacterales bacterium]